MQKNSQILHSNVTYDRKLLLKQIDVPVEGILNSSVVEDASGGLQTCFCTQLMDLKQSHAALKAPAGRPG